MGVKCGAGGSLRGGMQPMEWLRAQLAAQRDSIEQVRGDVMARVALCDATLSRLEVERTRMLLLGRVLKAINRPAYVAHPCP